MHYLAVSLFDTLLAGDTLRVLDCGASGGEAARWRFLGRKAEIHALLGQGQAANDEAPYIADPIAEKARPLAVSRILKLAAVAEVMGQLEYAFELLAFARCRAVDATQKDPLDRLIKDATRYYTVHDNRRVQSIRRLLEKIATRIPQPLLQLLRPLDRLLPLR